MPVFSERAAISHYFGVILPNLLPGSREGLLVRCDLVPASTVSDITAERSSIAAQRVHVRAQLVSVLPSLNPAVVNVLPILFEFLAILVNLAALSASRSGCEERGGHKARGEKSSYIIHCSILRLS
jgi:hypothetical protein